MIRTHCNPHPAFWMGFYLPVSRLQKKALKSLLEGKLWGRKSLLWRLPPHLLNAGHNICLANIWCPLDIRSCAVRQGNCERWRSQLELRGPITWHATWGLCQAKLKIRIQNPRYFRCNAAFSEPAQSIRCPSPRAVSVPYVP